MSIQIFDKYNSSITLSESKSNYRIGYITAYHPDLGNSCVDFEVTTESAKNIIETLGRYIDTKFNKRVEVYKIIVINYDNSVRVENSFLIGLEDGYIDKPVKEKMEKLGIKNTGTYSFELIGVLDD